MLRKSCLRADEHFRSLIPIKFVNQIQREAESISDCDYSLQPYEVFVKSEYPEIKTEEESLDIFDVETQEEETVVDLRLDNRVEEISQPAQDIFSDPPIDQISPINEHNKKKY